MTTAFLIELAWKSTLTLGVTLAALRLLKHRSAAERSWLAHAGLLVTLLLPLVLLAAPRWTLEAPAPVADMLVAAPIADFDAQARPVLKTTTVIETPATAPAAATHKAPAPEHRAFPPEGVPDAPLPLWMLAYAAPAALLLSLTLVAVVRLVGLRKRANVLVENSWLSALAQAQRRMGFKHGTALLVSRDIGSPVSWGVLRPVILLNEEAIRAPGQAEAIIAHELAHVAGLDWMKLLLARVTAAVFWFNPLVWVLAKACHQLREEAADDAVLASDVPDLDYAELLVGVARHESGALLLAANGVAPSRGSLARRVARVLDTSRRRAPARLGWAAACTLGVAAFAAPLAALTLARVEAPVAPLRLAAVPAPVAAPRAAAAPLAPPTPATTVVIDDATTPAAPPAPTALAAVAPVIAIQPVATPAPAALAAAIASQVTASMPVNAVAPTDITLPRFSSISLNGGGRVILRHGKAQKVRVVSGDASNAEFAVAGDSLAISACRGNCGDLVIELTVPKVEAIAISKGGVIEARGDFPPMREIAIAVSQGGHVDVRAIAVDEVAAAIEKGGTINTTARKDLAVHIGKGGSVRYWGDPEVATAVSGGGSVERAGN